MKRYAAALLGLAVIILGAVQVAAPGGFTGEEVGQLVALTAGTGATYLLPLVSGRWAGALKTGAALVSTVAVLLIPILYTGAITAEQILMVAVAAVNVLATEIGVNVRTAPEPAPETGGE